MAQLAFAVLEAPPPAPTLQPIAILLRAANDNACVAYELAGRPAGATFGQVSGTPGVAWTYDAAGRRLSRSHHRGCQHRGPDLRL